MCCAATATQRAVEVGTAVSIIATQSAVSQDAAHHAHPHRRCGGSYITGVADVKSARQACAVCRRTSTGPCVLDMADGGRTRRKAIKTC